MLVSDKLSRPFKGNVLCKHIEKSIVANKFQILHARDSYPELRFKLDNDQKTLAHCSLYISTIIAAKQECNIYEPLTKLLTKISHFVYRMQSKDPRTSALTDKNSLLMFVPQSSSIQKADDGKVIRPDIAGVEATIEEVVGYLEDDVLPDWFSSLHWSQLMSVGEIKLAKMPDLVRNPDLLQLLSYVWCANHYQPNCFIHNAILAYKTGVFTLKYCPNSMIISPNCLYSQYEALVQYVYDLHYPQRDTASMAHAPGFTNLKFIQSPSDEPMTKLITTALEPTFRYTIQDGHATTEYAIFNLFHGLGFGWQAFVGLGAKLTKGGASPQVIILKVYCREHVCWFKEEDVLQGIHKVGNLPGVPRICQDMVEQPFVLSTHHAHDSVQEACMISLIMTGQSLSMCKDILQFFEAMYDLTEGLYLSSLIFIETNMLQFIAP